MMKRHEVKTIAHTKDRVLPILKLPNPCPIKVNITRDYILLYVGQRDWQWDRKTGELIGQGTCV